MHLWSNRLQRHTARLAQFLPLHFCKQLQFVFCKAVCHPPLHVLVEPVDSLVIKCNLKDAITPKWHSLVTRILLPHLVAKRCSLGKSLLFCRVVEKWRMHLSSIPAAAMLRNVVFLF